jgi:hypothetical protein
LTIINANPLPAYLYTRQSNEVVEEKIAHALAGPSAFGAPGSSLPTTKYGLMPHCTVPSMQQTT